MKKLLIIPLIVFAVSATAQKLSFSSINNAGLIAGDKGESFMLQSINGIKKGKWFAGIGAGLDFYHVRTIPLFVDVRWQACNKPQTPFVYAEAGTNFQWQSEVQKQNTGLSASSAGMYCDIGAGWKIALLNSLNFVMSAGYSIKKVNQSGGIYMWTPVIWDYQPNGEKYAFTYRRIVVKVGLQF